MSAVQNASDGSASGEAHDTPSQSSPNARAKGRKSKMPNPRKMNTWTVDTMRACLADHLNKVDFWQELLELNKTQYEAERSRVGEGLHAIFNGQSLPDMRKSNFYLREQHERTLWREDKDHIYQRIYHLPDGQKLRWYLVQFWLAGRGDSHSPQKDDEYGRTILNAWQSHCYTRESRKTKDGERREQMKQQNVKHSSDAPSTSPTRSRTSIHSSNIPMKRLNVDDDQASLISSRAETFDPAAHRFCFGLTVRKGNVVTVQIHTVRQGSVFNADDSPIDFDGFN